MEAKPMRVIYVPTRVRLWTQSPNYVAVIKDEWDKKFLERYVGETVTLKISGIYVTGTLIKVKHGRAHDIEMILPKRLKPMWEILRRKGIEHDAVVILRVENEEEEVV
jgi:serine kinase of HPr protein (carbohydrate metabolism regulator)